MHQDAPGSIGPEPRPRYRKAPHAAGILPFTLSASRDIVAGRLRPILMEFGVTRMRQDLINAAARHDVTAEKNTDDLVRIWTWTELRRSYSRLALFNSAKAHAVLLAWQLLHSRVRLAATAPREGPTWPWRLARRRCLVRDARHLECAPRMRRRLLAVTCPAACQPS